MPLGRRDGGVLLALPASAIADEDLHAAYSSSFPGEIGPYRLGDARVQNRQGRLLASKCRVLVVELAVSSDCPLLCYYEESAEEASQPFLELRGTPYWPAPTELLSLKSEWLASYTLDSEEQAADQVASATRCTPYQTADVEESAGAGGGAAAAPFGIRGPPARRRLAAAAPAGAVASPRASGAAPPWLLRRPRTRAARLRPRLRRSRPAASSSRARLRT